HGYFDLQSAWSWYVRRSENRPQVECLRRFIEVQTKVLAPFTPHMAEECGHRNGGAGFVVAAAYPDAKVEEINPRAEAAEGLLQSTLADIREILKVTGIAPKRMALYTAPSWKVSVHEVARELATQGALAMNVLMEKALAQPGMRDRAKEVAAYAKQVADELKHARVEHLDRFDSMVAGIVFIVLRGVVFLPRMFVDQSGVATPVKMTFTTSTRLEVTSVGASVSLSKLQAVLVRDTVTAATLGPPLGGGNATLAFTDADGDGQLSPGDFFL